MSTNEERAREILEQSRKDNAAHHVGISKHRVWNITKALDEAEARGRRAGLLAAYRAIRDAMATQGQNLGHAAFQVSKLLDGEKEAGKNT